MNTDKLPQLMSAESTLIGAEDYKLETEKMELKMRLPDLCSFILIFV